MDRDENMTDASSTSFIRYLRYLLGKHFFTIDSIPTIFILCIECNGAQGASSSQHLQR